MAAVGCFLEVFETNGLKTCLSRFEYIFTIRMWDVKGIASKFGSRYIYAGRPDYFGRSLAYFNHKSLFRKDQSREFPLEPGEMRPGPGGTK